jgi:hypothetical protein
MPIITTMTAEETKQRRPLHEVLGIEKGDASPRGSTYWKTLMTCAREFALRYEAQLEPEVVGEPLTLGLLWHFILEELYTGVEVAELFRVLDHVEQEPGYYRLAQRAQRMLDRYLDVHREDKWRVLCIEQPLQYASYHPHVIEYSARLDLVVVRDGRTWIVEHKSHQRIDANTLDNYQLDLQVLGQVWLWKNAVRLDKYPPFGGVLINVVSTGNTVEVARVECCPSRLHLEAFERTLRSLCATRAHAGEAGWPQSLGHCAGFARGYGRCAYYALCQSQPTRTIPEWTVAETPWGFVRREKQGNANRDQERKPAGKPVDALVPLRGQRQRKDNGSRNVSATVVHRSGK